METLAMSKAERRRLEVMSQVKCDDPGFSDTGGGRIMVPLGGPKNESIPGRSVAEAASVF